MFDLDAVVTETTRAPFEFTFGGQTFSLPASLDIAAAAALEGGQLYEGMRKLLGAQQWERLVALEAVLDEKRLTSLMQAYGEHLGIPVGESQASTDS